MSTPLQEFVVSLKYKQDGSSQRQFFDGIKKSENAAISFGSKVGAIGAAIVGMTALAAKGTNQYSKGLEQLFFSARRTGTSIKNLNALGQAGESLGSSVQGAQGSLESLAKFMRSNPSSSNFLKSIGVQTKDAKGHALDTVQVMQNLGGAFRNMPVYMATQYASMFGISDNMMLAMRDPKFNGNLKQYESAQGNSVDKAGNSAHNLQNAGRVFDAHKFGLKAEAMSGEMDALTKTTQFFNKNLEDTNSLFSNLLKLWGWNSANGNPIGVGGGALAGGLVVKKLLSNGATTTAEKVTTAEAVTAGTSRVIPWLAKAGLGVALLTHSESLNEGEADPWKGRPHKMGSGIGRDEYGNPMAFGQIRRGGGATRGMRNNNPGNMRYGAFAKSHGATSKDSGGFAIFPSMGAGEAAEQALLRNYLKGGHDTISKVISRWAPSSENNTGAYIGSVVAQMGIGANQRLNGSNIPLLAAAINRQENGAASVAQTINTTINVTGTKDPEGNAKAISNAQRQVNQQLARNSAGAYR